MPKLAMAPPHSEIEAVTEILHGVEIVDDYRWLEEQDSPRTRAWLQAQTAYARAYLDAIPGREGIRRRVRELLDVETCDSVQKAGKRYFFRKRLPGQEQFSIYCRDGADGSDQLLIDPGERGTGPYTAVKPLRVSPDGRLLLYEVKEGGERTGTFEILDIETRTTLSDVLARGYLRGFAFAPDSKSFYYVHEPLSALRPHYRAAYHHVLGTSFDRDRAVFFAGEDPQMQLRIVAGIKHIGFLVSSFHQTPRTDFLLWSTEANSLPLPVVRHAAYKFGPLLLKSGRILAITDRDAPNFRIVEVRIPEQGDPEFVDIVPGGDARIQNWVVAGERVFVSYLRNDEVNDSNREPNRERNHDCNHERNFRTEIEVFDLTGNRQGQLRLEEGSTTRLAGGFGEADEVLVEQESFTQPIRIWRYGAADLQGSLWAKRSVPFASQEFDYRQIWFTAKDGTRTPMYLVGRPEVLENGCQPAIMTAYGGYGVAMTPQFSVLVALLMEHGCLFALPNIRGGSEFGCGWHEAAKRRKRQVAFDDFLAAAEWLIASGHSKASRLAIFGGSNSGLLVGAALTQRPELFRAVLCMVPLLDMLRYHRFDNAQVWKEEFGTAEDAAEFAALLGYSPYQKVREETAYPATMLVSGDADRNCNPLHARKMTARLQAANASESPIFLDYSQHRGHSPVLPLSERVEALTDRVAFLVDQLGLRI